MSQIHSGNTIPSMPCIGSILAIGDDPLLLATRSQVLAMAGFRVALCDTAIALPSLLLSGDFQLLLLCHSVPAEDCQTAVTAARQHAPRTRVVALTSYAVPPCSNDQNDVVQINVGKGPDHLIAALHALLDSPAAAQTTPEELDMSQYEGQVKWFNNAKGYGFVGRNDGGNDVFTHYSSIQCDGYKTLAEGDTVSFDVIQGEKGPQAENVKVLHKA